MSRRYPAALATMLAAGLAAGCGSPQEPPPAQPEIGSRQAPRLERDGLAFRDLNRSGQLDAYEDWRLPAAERAADLVSRMTVEEKAGVMMHGTAPVPRGGTGVGSAYDAEAAEQIVLEGHVDSMITRLRAASGVLAG